MYSYISEQWILLGCFKFDPYCTVHTKERQTFNAVLKLEYDLPHQNGCTISIFILFHNVQFKISENERTIYPPIVFSLVNHSLFIEVRQFNSEVANIESPPLTNHFQIKINCVLF